MSAPPAITTTLSNLTTAKPGPHKPLDPHRESPHPPENSTAGTTTARPANGQKMTTRQSTKTEEEERKRKQQSLEKKKNENR
ncbi:hypothetical protein P8452_38320 [Trifolium repens]|nr:hypothetical protein P8452_38320 [Trifolium repens]